MKALRWSSDSLTLHHCQKSFIENQLSGFGSSSTGGMAVHNRPVMPAGAWGVNGLLERERMRNLERLGPYAEIHLTGGDVEVGRPERPAALVG